MDFVLRYRGLLPPTGNARDKHRIRQAIDPQLQELCRQETLVREALDTDLPEGVFNSIHEVEVQPAPKKLFYFVLVGGFHFVPIIHRAHGLICALEVIFLRREKLGAIIHGGDMDNRLKTLFDALRIPHHERELPEISPQTPNERMYCLLEDDSLITRLSVQTQQLLEPVGPDEDRATVELLLRVFVQSIRPMWGNIGF